MRYVVYVYETPYGVRYGIKGNALHWLALHGFPLLYKINVKMKGVA